MILIFQLNHACRTYKPDFSLNKNYLGQNCSPIFEYGGWGIKKANLKRGKAYNISGNRGLQIEFIDKRKLLIGTRNAEELERVLSKMGKIEQK